MINEIGSRSLLSSLLENSQWNFDKGSLILKITSNEKLLWVTSTQGFSL